MGIDVKSIKTNYKEHRNYYILNGKKKWITLSGIADVIIVVASNEGNVTAFIVDSKSEGITITPVKGLLASKAAYISDIEFKDVHVPKENIFGNVGG